MGIILSALLSLLHHSLDAVKQVAIQLKAAFIQAKGFLLALFVQQGKSVILMGLVWSATFLLLNTTLQAILSLLVGLSSWLGITESVRNLVPYFLQGVVASSWDALALDTAFSSALMVFSAWVSGWAIFRGVQYSVILRKFSIVKGFWPGLARWL